MSADDFNYVVKVQKLADIRKFQSVYFIDIQLVYFFLRLDYIAIL